MKSLNENDRTIFKAKCQSEFDELLPKAYSLIAEGTGKPCDTEIILRYADLGFKAGTYGRYIPFEKGYKFCVNVTLNTQLIERPDSTKPTITHELAHFVIEHIKQHRGITTRRGKWGVHGSEWKEADRSLGGTGSRCHQMRLDTARFKVRMTQRKSDGSEYHCYRMTRKDAKHCLADPKYLKVEVKDEEGFWVPLPDTQKENPLA
jgi:hypothetical protein